MSSAKGSDMGEFLSYSIESGLLLLALYLGYRLFLARENQHSYNRNVLLLIYALSFAVVPLLSLARSVFQTGTSQDVAFVYFIANVSAESAGYRPAWGVFLIWLYIGGLAVTVVKTCVTWIRIFKVIRSGEKVLRNGYTLILTDDSRFAPFSWMRFVVMSREDFDENYSAVMTHELKHVSSRHWVDLLVAQVVCIINWFNPAAWLMRDELMLVHEYEADLAVIESGFDPRQYQMLLIKKAVGARFPSLANSLNHSKLKKRITMMYKEKSGAGRKFKALALVPMLALALGVASVPAVRAAVATIGSSDVSVGKGNENLPSDKTSGKIVKVFNVKNLNNNGNVTNVTVVGENLGSNLTVSGGTFTTKGKTYRASALQCNMTNGVATITATFPFTSEYENTSMTLIVNGEEVPFNLDGFLDKAGNIVVSSDNSSLLDNIVIYVDGEKISATEMNNISPEKIESITIDKQSNSIKITLKK